jgi:hypothetical protein
MIATAEHHSGHSDISCQMAFKLSRSILGIVTATCVAGLRSETQAADDHFKRSGKAGREVAVYGYTLSKADCSFDGFPLVFLDEPPLRGFVCLRIRNLPVRLDVFGKAPHCVGRTARSVQVIYLPRYDFVGTDKMHYTVVFPNGLRTVMVTFEISAAKPRGRDAPAPGIAAPMPEMLQSPRLMPFCSALVS